MTKPKRKHPWEAQGQRTPPDTKNKNTHRDPEPLLILIDKPVTKGDRFLLEHKLLKEKDKAYSEIKPRGKFGTSKVVTIDDAHVAIEVAVPADKRDADDVFRLTQSRGKTDRHLIFRSQNGNLLTMAGEPQPTWRDKQYFPIPYSPPSTTDDDLKAEVLDYRKVVAEDPKAP
jgi:hypothetical protein